MPSLPSGGVAFAVVLPGVHVNLARQSAQPACRGATDAARQLPPFVVRRHDHESPLLLPLVDEVVDPVARPARPILGSEVVEDDDVVPTWVRRRLTVAIAFAQGVEPGGDVEEERGLLLLAPD